VIPVLTPAEVRAVDASADVPVEVLIDRAAAAVAREAIRMLGGSYGRVVNVIAGPGNNGADGRCAADKLAARGVKVRLFEADSCPAVLPAADLVIDAAYGTGFHGVWSPPGVGAAKVLAVDIPSGVDAQTGVVSGAYLAADVTVTFAAGKPGLYFATGRSAAGKVIVADIGLDVGAGSSNPATIHVVEAADLRSWARPRRATDHKWSHAVRVVAGSPGMGGAAALVAGAAQRAGAGIVHLSSPGLDAQIPVEVVGRRLPAFDWAPAVLADLHRFHALVVGPGLGREDYTVPSVTSLVAESVIPVVVDGDGLFALAWNADGAPTMLRARQIPTILTPHDGEYAILTGSPPGPDRVLSARQLASDTGAVVLLKGPVTVVAEPNGNVYLVTNGNQRLATAGSGDVLAGVIAGFISAGLALAEAAAAAAWVHAQAGAATSVNGTVATDLIEALPQVMDTVIGPVSGAATTRRGPR
jgi:hydroxyethylthiazole kinase-like uncharacterized protein yjeF